jgi:cytochrome P450
MYKLKQDLKENPRLRIRAHNFANDVVLDLFDPVLIKDFFSKQLSFVKDSRTSGVLKKVLGDGLVFAEGENWKQKRRLISTVFHFDLFQSSMVTLRKYTKKMIERLDSKTDQPVELIIDVQRLTSEAVGNMFFGDDLQNLKHKGKNIEQGLVDIASETTAIQNSLLNFLFGNKALKWLPLPKNRWLNREVAEYRTTVLNYINERKKGFNIEKMSSKPDLLSLLFSKQATVGGLTDDEILNEFTTFIFAGTDTTSNTVQVTLYLLAKHPEIQDRVRAEVDSLYNDTDDIKIDELNKLVQLHGALYEGLRMYGPANGIFSRTALRDLTIGEYKVKKGTILMLPSTFNLFNPLYHDNPEEFDIDRWIKPSSKSKSVDPFAFIPFSAGSRNCIGQHLALIQAKVILSSILKKFDVKIKEDYKFRMNFKAVYQAEDPVPFIFSNRKN